ncbi:MAG: 1-phosphofructokinase [Oscillospiraceae bacterium]
MIYTVTFNPALDYAMNVQALEDGIVNRSDSEYLSFGGKGINVSGILLELDRLSVALGFIAGFTGIALNNALTEKNICTDFVTLPKGLTRINIKIKSDAETDINACGPSIDEVSLEKLYKKINKLTDGDILILSGSVPSFLNDDAYAKILEQLKKKKILCVVDATKKLLLNTLPFKPFLIKPNRQELAELFDKTTLSDDEIENCAKSLQLLGARNVLVSLADDGAFLLDENGVAHTCATVKGEVVNSVGAGDAMVAGFMSAWLDKKDYDYALRLGTACGAATAFSKTLAKKDEIFAILEKI